MTISFRCIECWYKEGGFNLKDDNSVEIVSVYILTGVHSDLGKNLLPMGENSFLLE